VLKYPEWRFRCISNRAAPYSAAARASIGCHLQPIPQRIERQFRHPVVPFAERATTLVR
jgi:hypothetical protein